MDRRTFLKSAGIIAGAMYADLPTLAQNMSRSTGPVRLRIGILSDTHIDHQPSLDDLLNALRYFRDRHADGILIAGDITDLGFVSQMKMVADAWYEVFPHDKLPDGEHIEKLFIYGNHDVEFDYFEDGTPQEVRQREGIRYNRAKHWKRFFHEKYEPVYMKTVKGYRFIGAHWDDRQHVTGVPEFLEAHRNELQGDKPFFYFQHAHPKDTTYGEWAWGQDNGESTHALSRFPNAVAFSGHSHMPLDNERALWQGSFTSIGTASLRYMLPLGARENSYVDGSDEEVPSQMKIMDVYAGRQGMLMEVFDDSISLERIDFVHNEPIADPWIIPLPVNGSPLSFERREQTAKAPEFPKDSKVEVSFIPDGEDRYGVRQPQVRVSFPTVLKKTTGQRAIDYEVQLEQQYVDVVSVLQTKRVYSPGCFFSENYDEEPVVCLFSQHDLPQNRSWRFTVRPCESFGHKGRPIYSAWQKPKE